MQKRIVFSRHADRRLGERRQEGITHEDVCAACHLAKEILSANVPEELKLRLFNAKSGVKFDMVVVDRWLEGEKVLLIVTVIGRKYNKTKPLDTYGGMKMQHLTYKQRVKCIRKQKKRERKFIENIKAERNAYSTKRDKQFN